MMKHLSQKVALFPRETNIIFRCNKVIIRPLDPAAYNVFLIGFKDLLICLRLLEKMGEIPEIGNKWWLRMATLYGNDILMVEFKEEE